MTSLIGKSCGSRPKGLALAVDEQNEISTAPMGWRVADPRRRRLMLSRKYDMLVTRGLRICDRHRSRRATATMTSSRGPHRPNETKFASGKRRHTRYLLNAPITAVLSGTPEIRSRSRTLDVSESGIGGLFHDNWEPGLRLNLEIAVPIGRVPLKLVAIVRHHTDVRYGFEFIDVLPQERATLRELCQFLAIRPAR